MAIEITPGAEVKKTIFIRIVLFTLLVFFLISFLSYFILIFYQSKLKRDLSDLEKKLLRTPSEKSLEQNLKANKKKIEDWKFIATNYPLALRVFDFLEKNNHPQVWFSDFNLNLENATLSLVAQAENFEVLGQQLLIFKNQEIIKEINLSNVSVNKEGKVLFGIQLIFDSKIFNPVFSLDKK